MGIFLFLIFCYLVGCLSAFLILDAKPEMLAKGNSVTKQTFLWPVYFSLGLFRELANIMNLLGMKKV